MATGDETRENNKIRLQFDFSHEAYDRLLQLRVETGVETNAEVVRNALRLYEWFLAQKRQGSRIQLVKDDVIMEAELLL